MEVDMVDTVGMVDTVAMEVMVDQGVWKPVTTPTPEGVTLWVDPAGQCMTVDQPTQIVDLVEAVGTWVVLDPCVDLIHMLRKFISYTLVSRISVHVRLI